MNEIGYPLFVGLLMLGAGCGDGRLREFSPPDGSFKVLLPTTPKIETNSGPEKNATSYIVNEPGKGDYVVTVKDMPNGTTADSYLDSAVINALNDPNRRVSKFENVTLGGTYRGREMSVRFPSSSQYVRSRMFIVERKVYLLTVIGPQSWVDSSEATRMLQSFTVTK